MGPLRDRWRKRLAGENPTPLERLLVNRVVVDQLHELKVKHLLHAKLNGAPISLAHFVTAFRAAFEPLTLTVERVIAEGDRVLMRSYFAATFAGEFMGLAAIRKQVA